MYPRLANIISAFGSLSLGKHHPSLSTFPLQLAYTTTPRPFLNRSISFPPSHTYAVVYQKDRIRDEKSEAKNKSPEQINPRMTRWNPTPHHKTRQNKTLTASSLAIPPAPPPPPTISSGLKSSSVILSNCSILRSTLPEHDSSTNSMTEGSIEGKMSCNSAIFGFECGGWAGVVGEEAIGEAGLGLGGSDDVFPCPCPCPCAGAGAGAGLG